MTRAITLFFALALACASAQTSSPSASPSPSAFPTDTHLEVNLIVTGAAASTLDMSLIRSAFERALATFVHTSDSACRVASVEDYVLANATNMTAAAEIFMTVAGQTEMEMYTSIDQLTTNSTNLTALINSELDGIFGQGALTLEIVNVTAVIAEVETPSPSPSPSASAPVFTGLECLPKADAGPTVTNRYCRAECNAAGFEVGTTPNCIALCECANITTPTPTPVPDVLQCSPTSAALLRSVTTSYCLAECNAPGFTAGSTPNCQELCDCERDAPTPQLNIQISATGSSSVELYVYSNYVALISGLTEFLGLTADEVSIASITDLDANTTQILFAVNHQTEIDIEDSIANLYNNVTLLEDTFNLELDIAAEGNNSVVINISEMVLTISMTDGDNIFDVDCQPTADARLRAVTVDWCNAECNAPGFVRGSTPNCVALCSCTFDNSSNADLRVFLTATGPNATTLNTAVVHTSLELAMATFLDVMTEASNIVSITDVVGSDNTTIIEFSITGQSPADITEHLRRISTNSTGLTDLINARLSADVSSDLSLTVTKAASNVVSGSASSSSDSSSLSAGATAGIVVAAAVAVAAVVGSVVIRKRRAPRSKVAPAVTTV